MTKQEKITLLEEIMELEEGTLTEDMILEDIEEWDSLSKLSLMAEVKNRLNKVLTVDEIRGFKIVKDICNYLS